MTRSMVGFATILLSFSLFACGDDDKVMDVSSNTTFVTIDEFSVDSLRVVPGETVKVVWEVRNAASIVLLANNVPVDLGGMESGEVQVRIEERTSLRLEAAGGDGVTVHRMVVVETKRSNKNPLILSFVASPSEIDAGEESTLTWTTANATSVEVFDGAGASVPLQGASADSGSVTVSPGDLGNYRLVATGEEGTTERTLFIKVRGVPLAELSVSKATVAAGEAVTLTWSVKDASRLSIREVDGDVIFETTEEFQGSLDVFPAHSTTYELRATGSWRDSVSLTKVDVGPELVHFDVVETGPIGESKLATLSWKTAGAVAVKVSNLEGFEETITGFRVPEGTARVPMAAGGKFRIVVMGGAGDEISKEIQAEVLASPTIASLTVDPPLTSQQLQPIKVVVAWEGIRDAEEVILEGDTFGKVGIFRAPFDDGSIDLWLRETANITMTVKNSAGELQKTVTATLVPLPKIPEFFPFPRHAGVGETTTVSWDVVGAQSISIEWNGDEIHQENPTTGTGSISRVITEPGSFRLVATNSAGGVTATSRAVTVGSPEIRSFGLPETTVPPNTPLEFFWTTLGGTSLTLHREGVLVCQANTLAAIEKGGCTIPGDQLGEGNFTLRLTNGLGESVVRQLRVLITDGPIIESMTVSHDDLCKGEKATISWSITPDRYGNLPNLTLVDNLGNEFDISKEDPLSGSTALSYSTEGIVQFTLSASTPGTFVAQKVFHIEMLEPIAFHSASAHIQGGDVVVDWDAEGTCTAGVKIETGKAINPSDPFVDVRSTGTLVPITTDCNTIYPPSDEGCEVLTFPPEFVFPFGGQDRTQIKVFSNGFAGFDLTFTGNNFSNASLPSTSYTHVNISPFWDDLHINGGPVGVYTELYEEYGREGLIIQWAKTGFSSTHSDNLNYQAILWEDGGVDYRYGIMTASTQTRADGSSTTIGLHAHDGSSATMISYNSTVSGGLSNRSFTFGPAVRGPSGTYSYPSGASSSVMLQAFGRGNSVSTTVPVTP